jgi:DNA-binding Lrp family transcriptional regulator
MDTISAAALARELGTSVPRVVRAIEQLGIDARQANGRFAIMPRQADRLRRRLGVVPRAAGVSRSETVVLAALRSAPLGLVSARAVSRRSGLSPTAARRALKSLLAQGLVEQASEVVAAGRARQMTIWRANPEHPRWPDLDPVLGQVAQPQRPLWAGKRVPRRLRHLFWNTAESQLEVTRAGAYIARRLLQTMDLQGLAWGAQALRAEDWERGALARGLDPKVKRLARNLAEAAG